MSDKELTPELAEKLKAAKTPEAAGKLLGVDIGACEKTPLSLAELDAVAGGGIGGWLEPPDDFCLWDMNRHEAIIYIEGLVDAFGMDVAIEFLNEAWTPTRDWERIRTGGVAYTVDYLWGKAYYAAVNGMSSTF